MIWKLSIIDRSGITHVLKQEPVGMDAIEITVKRDLEKHGVILDYSANDLTFYEPAAVRLIQAEANSYGLEGNLTLVIGYDCGNGVVAELYRGKMLFALYKYGCGSTCSVSIPVETTGDVMKLRNRIDQKVNLDNLTAFDNSTTLSSYPGLGVSVLLPSKGIFLQNKAINETAITEYFDGETQALIASGVILLGYFTQLSIPFGKTVAAEIGSFYVPPTPTLKVIANAYGSSAIQINSRPDRIKVQTGTDYTWEWPLDADVLENYYQGTPNFGTVDYPAEIKYRVKWSIAVTGCYVNIIRQFFLRLPEGKDGTQWDHYEVLQVVTLFSAGNYDNNVLPGARGELKPGDIRPYDTTYTNSTFRLNPGDRLYHYESINYYKTLQQLKDTKERGIKAFDVRFDYETAFSITALSHTTASPAKLYMPNEAWSRVTEAVTDGAIRAYSEYFGRTDSLPYSHASDGCGSLQPITNGIRIRQQENRNPATPIAFSVSVNDLFDGFNPIHNIGYGLEADPQRPGFKRLRIEPWKHFYDNTIVLTCNNVAEVEHTFVSAEHYSTASFGYQKWQTEEVYNQLDDIFSKRQFRTTLSQVKGELNRLSTFIASPYAIEGTRRKQTESSDWRYDNDTFVICLTRKGGLAYNVSITTLGFMSLNGVTVAPAWAVVGATFTLTSAGANDGTYTIASVSVGVFPFVNVIITSSFPAAASNVGVIVNSTLIAGFTVELGNVTGNVNLIEPSTLYNYRISPIRNILRWIDKLFASYRNQVGAKLLFMSGEGNYTAAGEQHSTVCKLENGVISENQDIDATLFANSARAVPILQPERIKFEYPLKFGMFLMIQANPWGLIAYNNDCINGQGWIDEVTYKLNDGLATFILIPKIV